MQRFTKSNPCPICGGHDADKRGSGKRCFGFMGEDGKWVHCTREEFSGSLERNQESNTYAHLMEGQCKCGATHGKPRSGMNLVCTYDYKDEEGNLIAQVCRYSPKTFRQRRPDGAGNWIWGLAAGEYEKTNGGDWRKAPKTSKGPKTKFGGTRLVLYGLKEVIERIEADVYLVEGEKDVQTMRKHGFLATTNLMGAKKWRKQYNEFLKDRNIIIIPDNDEDGKTHAQRIAESLIGTSRSIRILALPGAGEKEDVTDWFAAGGTLEQLKKLVSGAAEFNKASLFAYQQDNELYLTDLGNAERLVKKYGDKIRYCHPWKCWFIWDGKRWERDITGNINFMARETVRGFYAEAAKLDKADDRKAMAEHARKSESETRIHAMVILARSEKGVSVVPDQFDRHWWMLNCRNGIVDLRTGEMRNHRREDMITKVTSAPYDVDIDGDSWRVFIDEVLPDPELQSYVQLAAGYSCAGTSQEEILLFVYGPTASGKSTFLEAIGSSLGDYAATADFESFLKGKSLGPRADIARLAGKRFVRSIEVDRGRRLAEGLIKTLVGGDTVVARRLYQDEFEFRPEFTLWLCANDKPKASNDDEALWRRIKPIPFMHKIPVSKRDPGVKRKLCDTSVSGTMILRWLVEGAKLWYKHGLEEPKAVIDAIHEYQAENDPLAEWIDDFCILENGAWCVIGELYESYTKWADENKERYPLGRRAFSNQLKNRDMKCISKHIQGKTFRGYQGITLRSCTQ